MVYMNVSRYMWGSLVKVGKEEDRLQRGQDNMWNVSTPHVAIWLCYYDAAHLFPSCAILKWEQLGLAKGQEWSNDLIFHANCRRVFGVGYIYINYPFQSIFLPTIYIIV